MQPNLALQDGPSPNYPRRIGDVLVKRQQYTTLAGERKVSFSAELTDGYHTTIVSGPSAETEGGALRSLGDTVNRKAQDLAKQAERLLRTSTP